MLYKIITVKKPPSDISISPNAEEKALRWIKVLYYGGTYYIPLNQNLKKALKLKERSGQFYCDTYKQMNFIDKALRDIISALYIQIRDSIGSNITQSLSDEIQEGLEKLYQKQLYGKVMSKFPELPEILDHKEEEEKEDATE